MAKRRIDEEWIRVAVMAPRNAKLLKVPPAARWLWLAATCHCREHKTDGRFTAEVLNTMGVPKPGPLVTRLVEVGLFEVTPEGYNVHDYEEWQETREEVEARRAKGRERVANHRRNRAKEAE